MPQAILEKTALQFAAEQSGGSELCTEVERLEKELQAKSKELHLARCSLTSTRRRLEEVSQNRCLQQAKLNAITQELSLILPSHPEDRQDIIIPASAVAVLCKALFE
jgi:hypothetical protein